MTILDRMEAELMVPKEHLAGIVASASHHYKSYPIPKRAGGSRIIHHPSKELKALQRWLIRNIIASFTVHECAMGYRRGISTKHNAETHVSSRYLLRMDIVEFFTSITQDDVLQYLASKHRARISEVDAYVIARIVCRHGRLSIGAPTSPSLSNAMCYDLDVNLGSVSEAANISYTRYADDLFFSSNEPDVLGKHEHDVAQLVEECDCPRDLRINPEKTRHSSKIGRRAVTGVVLGSDGRVSIGRERKRELRTLIFLNSKGELDSQKKEYLRGMLGYLKSIEPGYINRLILKFGAEEVSRAMRDTSE